MPRVPRQKLPTSLAELVLIVLLALAVGVALARFGFWLLS
jgi:hypothetical protein